MIGLDDLRNLFQMILFYDSRIPAARAEVTPSSLATGSQSFHLSLSSLLHQGSGLVPNATFSQPTSLFSFLFPKRAKPKLGPALKQETKSVGSILGQKTLQAQLDHNEVLPLKSQNYDSNIDQ